MLGRPVPVMEHHARADGGAAGGEDAAVGWAHHDAPRALATAIAAAAPSSWNP